MKREEQSVVPPEVISAPLWVSIKPLHTFHSCMLLLHREYLLDYIMFGFRLF